MPGLHAPVQRETEVALVSASLVFTSLLEQRLYDCSLFGSETHSSELDSIELSLIGYVIQWGPGYAAFGHVILLEIFDLSLVA
jgi:hypothetical protein